jgi:hypothetical protein
MFDQDGALVILFQNIIEVLHRSMPAILLQSLPGFEPHDGRWITGVLGEEALSRCCVAFSRQKEVDHRTGESTARYKYTHLPLTRM